MKTLNLDDAIKAVTMLLDYEDDIDLIWSCDVINNLKNAPSVVDAESVRHGRWIYVGEIHKDNSCCAQWDCSECGSPQTFFGCNPFYRYCPICGAKMDGGAENVSC